jgi:DNA-binding response OmpR family regulator
LRILVVERDIHAREGLRSILSSDGHAVSVAEDIWAGFARVAVKPSFELVLLDDDVRLKRPKAMIRDLLAFARRKHPPTRGIVISSSEDDAPHYRDVDGVVAVLEKPVDLHRLRLELKALMSREARGVGA